MTKTMFGTFVLGLALVLGACSTSGDDGGGGGGGGGSGGSGGPSGGDDEPGNGSGNSSAHAPKILSLHTNGGTVTPNGRLVVSAVVTDPDGIDDLIGGNLTTPDGASAYGAFATDASEGAYSIAVTWSDLNTNAPITTLPGGTITRTLRAEFFDVAGNTASKTVDVTIGCGLGPDVHACNGACWEWWATEACGNSCEVCAQGETCLAQSPANSFCN